MKRVQTARWVILVVVFLTILGLPASVQAGDRLHKEGWSDCGVCSRTTPPVPSIPASFRNRPAAVPAVQRTVEQPSANMPDRNNVKDDSLPQCFEFESVMHDPMSGPSLSR